MKRVLAVLVLMVAFVMPIQAQTPEANHEQTSIAGSGVASIDVGDNDELAVVDVGTNDKGSYIQFIVHNGTDDTVSRIQVKVEATDTDGKLIAVKSTDLVRPLTLSSGDFAIGRLYLDGGFDTTANLKAWVVDYTDGAYPYQDNVSFGEVNITGDRIVGVFTNETAKDRDEIRLVAICADVSGTLITGNDSLINEPMPIGEPISFQIDASQWENAPCDTFIVAG